MLAPAISGPKRDTLARAVLREFWCSGSPPAAVRSPRCFGLRLASETLSPGPRRGAPSPCLAAGQRELNTRGAGTDGHAHARQMFSTLYGQTAAALYAKAAGQNAQARQLYNASADTYYKANDAAAYDDWVRARNHWDYFYNRS